MSRILLEIVIDLEVSTSRNNILMNLVIYRALTDLMVLFDRRENILFREPVERFVYAEHTRELLITAPNMLYFLF
jgi:hypothetical protein